MIRVFERERWVRVADDQPLEFVQGDRRVIRITVRPVVPSRLYLTSADGEAVFLASLIAGVEQVEFEYEPGFKLQCYGEVYVHSHDGVFHLAEHDGETFTEVAVRRERSPEIAAIEHKLLLNQLARERAMAHELERIRSLLPPAQAVVADDRKPPGSAGGLPAKPGDGVAASDAPADSAPAK